MQMFWNLMRLPPAPLLTGGTEEPDLPMLGITGGKGPFLDCLAELDPPIARLAGRGARAIVVAGMSQGGAAALAFGARRWGLAGIAANGDPGRLVRLFPRSRRASPRRGRWSPPAAATSAQLSTT
jgi:hypothetical protein